jgi:hypothetical protein
MGSKKDVDPMVQGLGTALNFMRKLIHAVEEQGGFGAQVHFLGTSRGEETLREIAKVIARAEWLVPLSILRQAVGDYSRDQGYKSLDLDMSWVWWAEVLAKLGIPYIYWHEGLGAFDGLEALVEQIKGKTFTDPVVVEHKGKKYVFTSFDTACTDIYEPGKVTFSDPIEKIEYFILVDAYRIHFER